MKSEDKIQICQEHCNAKGIKLNTDLPHVLKQSLNVDVSRNEQKESKCDIETEEQDTAQKTLRTTRTTSPWINFTDPIENRHRQPLPETLDSTYNGMGPFKPTIWTFDIMSRLEFLLTSAASRGGALHFLANGRTY